MNPCVTCNVVGVSSTRDRVRQHRERLRSQGLRPLQIWIPDVRAPEFIAEDNGLEQPSQLMVDKVTTVPRSGLGERLGKLRDEQLVALNRSLIVFLGLASAHE
jgi:Protein  of unknown function (DUF3018)/PemK-like, MazF-like toxin of type II toxin-antitoxin system